MMSHQDSHERESPSYQIDILLKHRHQKSLSNEKLFVSIEQTDKEGLVLKAVQTGEKKELNLKQLIINFFKYPLMTVKIISAIHFEAFLLWRKGAIYRPRDKKIKNNLSYEEY